VPEPKPPRTIARRDFLVALAGGAAALTIAPRALADGDPKAGSRIRNVSKSPHGTTLYLELEHAPFTRDRTVIVFVPSHFRFSPNERLCSVVHFHGINSSAEEAMTGNQLREQFFDSRQNAILVVPQGLKHSSDVSFGALEQPGGLARMLGDMTRQLTSHEAARELGAAKIAHAAHRGITCLSTHSGGYHGVAACLQHGDVEIAEVYLFDALYADTQAFRDWVVAGKTRKLRHRHKLVSYFPSSGTTATQNRLLKEQLEKAGIKCAFESVEGTLSRRELSHEQAVFVQTALSHGQVTWESNALRDCLFASILPRRVKSTWFKSSKTNRKIDERQ
jgi:hypothetical protein